MRQTVEEAAKEHQNKFEACDGAGTLIGFTNGRHKQSYESFIEGAEWMAQQSPWISVKERLPEESEFVLCRMVSNEAIVGGYIFVSPDGLPCVATLPNFEFDDYGGYVCDMWMPIPKFN